MAWSPWLAQCVFPKAADRAAIARCHQEAGPRFIAGAGCEVTRDTPHDNLRALCDYARKAR